MHSNGWNLDEICLWLLAKVMERLLCTAHENSWQSGKILTHGKVGNMPNSRN